MLPILIRSLDETFFGLGFNLSIVGTSATALFSKHWFPCMILIFHSRSLGVSYIQWNLTWDGIDFREFLYYYTKKV